MQNRMRIGCGGFSIGYRRSQKASADNALELGHQGADIGTRNVSGIVRAGTRCPHSHFSSFVGLTQLRIAASPGLTSLVCSQDRAALLEENMFLKDAEGTLFASPEFHALFQAISPTTNMISAPKMAFILLKLMQFFGGLSDARHSKVSGNPGALGDDIHLYKTALQLATLHAGKHWAKGGEGDDADEHRTLIHIMKPTEVGTMCMRACD